MQKRLENQGNKKKRMPKALLILALVFLLLSLLGNGGLLWSYGNATQRVQQLDQEIDRLSQELGRLQTERDGLDAQVRTLEAERSRLEAEKGRLEAELATYRGQEDVLEQLDRLEADVRAVRRQVPRETVERTFIARDQLRAYLEKQFAEEYPEQQAAVDAQVLAMLGLLDPGTDLYDLLLDLYTEQIMGFYDTKESRLYVVGEATPGSLERLVFVHEYVHALQDQVFDLGAQVDAVSDDSDRSRALLALAEGDASLAMQQYLLAHLSEFSTAELLSQTFQVETPKFDAAPEHVQQDLLFPYESGLSFVLSLYAGRGWAGVDAAWADPPQSSEHILHPERYPDDTPQVVTLPPLTATLGADWHFQDEDTLGEFLLRRHLALHLDKEQVDEAATGWGGDRYALYTQPGKGTACLVVRLVWDDRDEAEEFAKLYQTHAESAYGFPGDGTLEEGAWWAGRPGLYLWQKDDEVRLILAPDQDLAEKVHRRVR